MNKTAPRPPIEVRNEIVIRASAERVWDLLTDVGGWPSWWRACRWVRVESTGDDGRPASFRWKAHPVELLSTVVAASRPGLFVFVAKAPGISAHRTFTIHPAAHGGSTVVSHETQVGWLAWLGRLFLAPRLHSVNQACFTDLARAAKGSRPMKHITVMIGLPLVLCAGTLAGRVAPLLAQSQGDTRDGVGGRGFFQAGYLRFDLDGLNAALQGAGLPALDRDFFTLGGAGYGSAGRWLFGAEGHAVLGSDETTTDGVRRLSPGGGFGLLRAGYLALSRGGLDVYPTVGIGGGLMNLRIAELAEPTFDDVLASPGTATSLSTRMFLLDAGLAVSYRVGHGNVAGFLIGLQTGYTFAPGSSEWRLDRLNDVAGGPAFQIEGPYLRISLGGWR